jgi:hypothetical protein
MIARVVYPGGDYTGGGSIQFDLLLVLTEIFFYAFVWRAILARGKRKTRRVAV